VESNIRLLGVGPYLCVNILLSCSTNTPATHPKVEHDFFRAAVNSRELEALHHAGDVFPGTGLSHTCMWVGTFECIVVETMIYKVGLDW